MPDIVIEGSFSSRLWKGLSQEDCFRLVLFGSLVRSVGAAGTADASRSQSVEAAIQQRDSDIRAYFDTHVLKHVLNPDHQKRSLALTREICGLKVAHQQLIAAHAAARKLADAASLQGATLRQQLQVS